MWRNWWQQKLLENWELCCSAYSGLLYRRVLEVDAKRRRISLTMRLDDAPGDRATATRPAIAPSGSEKRLRPAERPGGSNRAPANSGGMAEAFRRAGLTGKAPGRR